MNPSNESQSNTKRTNLDIAFPSSLLIGIALLIAIILIGINGWKLSSFEAEKEKFEQERALWPQLKDELSQLQKEHTRLTNEKNALVILTDQLITNRNKLNEENNIITGNINENKGRLDTLLKDLSFSQAEIKKLIPERNRLNGEVNYLNEESNKITSEINSKKKQLSILQSEISGLEISRDNLKKMLDSINEDKISYERFNRNIETKFSKLIDNFENISNEFTKKLDNFSHVQLILNENSISLNKSVQDISKNSNEFSEIITSVNIALNASKKLNKDLTEATSNINLNNQELKKVIFLLQDMLNKINSDYNVATQSRKTLNNRIIEFNNLFSGIEQTTSSHITIINDIEQRLSQLSKNARDLEAILEGIRGSILPASNDTSRNETATEPQAINPPISHEHR